MSVSGRCGLADGLSASCGFGLSDSPTKGAGWSICLHAGKIVGAKGHESAHKGGKTIGGAGVTDDSMLSMALHLRDQEMSLRDITKRLVITTGAKKGERPSLATVIRMLREHDEQVATAVGA
ncbi:hypothetical protein ACWEWG_11290 [Streptomyces sp. NPDC003758]